MESDENKIEDAQTSSYLSASELMSFRKGSDEQFPCVVGQKLYNRTRTALEEQALECVLESHKDTLSQKRASRICDLMQAEWNKDLNVAIISKMKGKIVHHMGHAIDGKIGLSSEEAMFLLENRSIEIMNGKMLMSTEEGYAILLKGNMSVEKYHVYSHLSQLGFIVVKHQTQLGTVNGEKNTDVDKQQATRKRRSSVDLPEIHAEKRLTFAGALSSHNEKDSNDIEMSNVSVNREENSTSSDCQFLKINETAVCEEALKSTENAVSSTTNENGGIKNSEALSFACASQNFGDYTFNEKRTAGEDIAEVVPSGNLTQTEGIDDEVQLSSENAASKVVTTDDKSSKNVCQSFSESRESIIAESTGDGNSNEVLVRDSHDKNASATGDNDVMLPDSCNAIGITSGEESIEVTDGGSNQGRNYYQDQDIMSYSSEDNESDIVSFECDSSKCVVRENVEDDEVTLLEVKKKETKPLAVIDLLSDEEHGNMEVESENAQSDDEIQIVKVCSGSSSCNKTSGRKMDNRSYVECKKEEKNDVLSRSTKIPNRLQFPFPDLFRKDIACLPRPPSFLLPRNVRPAKEAYILDFKKQSGEQSRVWNSYRELQDFQRARRRGMMPDPSSNKFQRFESRWSQDQNFRRNYDSSKDYQNQTFNHHEQNDNQTVSSSQSRDFDIGSFSSGRDNHPANSSNNDVSSSNSSVTVRHQERSVGLFGIQQPMFPNPLLPMNIPMPNFQNMFRSNDLMSELHRTAYGVASNLLSAMLSQNTFPSQLLEFNTQQQGRTIFNFNEHNLSNSLNVQRNNGFMSSSPAITEHRNSPQNLMGSNSFGRNISTDSSYSRQRFNTSREEPGFLLPMPNGRRNRRDFRQRNNANRGKPFPCPYRHLNNKRSWSEVKAVVEKRNDDAGNDSNSDIEEVPININQVLWSGDIQPLVKPGIKYPVSEVLQSLKVTQMANLLNKETENERYLPTASYLEISFDVYLPATNYKKSCPGTPKHRVIVVRSTDPLPKYSEIVHLQRKWNDGAFLQLAVVDNGDISFYSFNSISLPGMIPHEP